MKNGKNRTKFIPKEILYKFALLVVSVFCIVYLLPRDSKTNMQFEENLPWPYSQLMAEFDFPIYKSEAAVQQEQDSIMADFSPYCRKLDSIPAIQIQALQQKLETIPEITDPQKILLAKRLKALYENGIIAGDEYATFVEDSIKNVMVYSKNSAYRVPLHSIYTTKSAYENLMNVDSLHLNRAVLQQQNIAELLQPNLIYDSQKSDEIRQELFASVSLTKGMVLAGTKIVDRGEIVTPEKYTILESWEKESNRRSTEKQQSQLILLGQIIFVTLIMGSFILYITLFRNEFFEEQKKILLLFFFVLIFPIVTIFMVTHNLLNVYVIPYAMAPIILRIFIDSRTAFMSVVVIALLSSLCLKYPYEFILIQVLSGLVSIMTLRELSQRSQLFKAALFITSINLLFYFSFQLIHDTDLSKQDISMYNYLCINGVLLLFTYPLLYMLEKVFGFTSDVTLVELSNINSPLLQRLSEVAPGTFQHSMQVANLAAEVAKKIGGKTQLVRTGALYHDIGKTNNPAFFTENQTSDRNPHNDFSEIQSAQIVINHVNDGLKLAEKYSLPKIIRDFITTHHGSGITKFFYINYCNKHKDEEIDPTPFTYPGPNPFTKEQAILMMADSVEAASRSLAEYTEDSIGNLVDKIVDQQMKEGYFHECPITFKDIVEAKAVFKEKLKIMYHTRIAYPELKKGSSDKCVVRSRKKK